MILAIRTDQPMAQLHLLSPDGQPQAAYEWEAHRTLAASLVGKVADFLGQHDTSTGDLQGIIIFTGQGSFTGLRIGTTVANALAYAHHIPVTAAGGKSWLETGVEQLKTTQPGAYATPLYDREPNITRPRES